jgi:hypothetical protein
MGPVTAASDVRKQKRDIGMPTGNAGQIDSVRRILIGPIPAAMLPDVLEDRQAMLRGERGDVIRQRIVRTSPPRRA